MWRLFHLGKPTYLGFYPADFDDSKHCVLVSDLSRLILVLHMIIGLKLLFLHMCTKKQYVGGKATEPYSSYLHGALMAKSEYGGLRTQFLMFLEHRCMI